MNQPRHTLTPEDIYNLLGGSITRRQIATNERTWGLHRCRIQINRRRFVYKAAPAISCLRALGLIP